jgi:hypothetical protein
MIKDISLSQIEMFVIDVLRYDIEAISSIIKLLNDRTIGWRNFWPHDFTESEVVEALKELLPKGLVKPLGYDKSAKELVDVEVENFRDIESSIEAFWFILTEKGWEVWNNWNDPPVEEENGSDHN